MLIAVVVTVAVILGAVAVVAAYLARSWSYRHATARTIRPEITPAAPCEKEDCGKEDVVGFAREHATATVDASDEGNGPGETIGSRDADTRQAGGCDYGPFETETQERLTRYTFDNFVVGTGNRSAYRLARAAAESPGLRFNPLFIYGGPGLGKTHLMCALASNVYERDSDTNVRYLTSQAFAEQILDAYRSREVEQFERQYIQTDVLLIDDIQLLAMSQSLQSVVARILGEIYEQGKQIVVSSDRRPQDLRGLAQEITARFSTGVIIEEIDRMPR